MTREPFGQLGRAVAIGVLLAALVGLTVWAGALPVTPMESEVPTEVEVTPDREAYVGEQVVLGGFVVDTDPVVLATWSSGDGRFTLVDADRHVQNADEPLETGDRMSAYGTLEDEETLAVERATVQQPSETRYMVIVSLLGGLWVAGRLVRDWRFDLERLAFVPREPARPSKENGDDDTEDDRERAAAARGSHARARAKPASESQGDGRSSGGERRG
ncbi:hypothetical protein CV102_08540 [Natronococcus pandeyae]|uniref:Uncharacterized protein n=1 Tax=Natronococcus pandeyae TaxID=2055836 RepID=A0A8J8Q7W1_9EURY|nr:hypothetical protein [Natronococcus pandeyae]TYL39314.1 hypothetical protein CV102_08540 [Natronococcus pandeyae]